MIITCECRLPMKPLGEIFKCQKGHVISKKTIAHSMGTYGYLPVCFEMKKAIKNKPRFVNYLSIIRKIGDQ